MTLHVHTLDIERIRALPLGRKGLNLPDKLLTSGNVNMLTAAP